MSHSIRLATPADCTGVLAIYGPYVMDTAFSFETRVPTPMEFAGRMQAICAKYPFLVYTIDENIVGYAYAGEHRQRGAYRFDVDVSIYLSPLHQGQGIAGKLYGCLFALLEALGYKNAYAAYTEPNEKSRKFHLKCGFAYIGTFHRTGFKFAEWHDVTWLEKSIGGHNENPEEPLRVGDLIPDALAAIFKTFME